jgi:hypothetical protein
MAGKEARALTFSEVIETSELELFLTELSQLPLAKPLVETFRSFADLDSAYINKQESVVYANAIDTNINGAMAIGRGFGGVKLEIYDDHVEHLPSSGWINVFCRNRATIWASPIKAGVWALGSGNLMTYGMTVRISSDVILPSTFARWLFGLLQSVAVTASVMDNDISEQPRFWDGNGGEEDD